MRLEFAYNDRHFVATDEHSAASYNQPVLLIDDELSDTRIAYEPDEPPKDSALDLLADERGVWGGPATRGALAMLAERMLGGMDAADVRGADYDRVIDAFIAEGKRRLEAELAEE